ncbi:uncharacterized protein [Clytia hemisphaerica]|uniref:uncharacterized protein n=1 Tax=Clytia hemisphaerica TaxID=252671 RepID=UPI0034D45B6B
MTTTNEVTTNDKTNERSNIIKWDHYSSWSKLKRQVAWLLKIKRNFRKSKTQPINWKILTSNELEEAEKVIIQIAQRESFTDETTAMKSKKLLQLKPFVDDDGILRVGGRIKHAKVDYTRKHQIVICSKHPIARILTLHFHESNFHCGREATLAILRNQFWLISGKKLCKNYN